MNILISIVAREETDGMQWIITHGGREFRFDSYREAVEFAYSDKSSVATTTIGSSPVSANLKR